MTIIEALTRLEQLGVKPYVGPKGKLRAKHPRNLPDEAYRIIGFLLEHREETKAILELWSTPATPEKAVEVLKAFTRPGSFVIFDESSGETRWIS